MGTHPIFESDFDCLTDLGRMGDGEGHFARNSQKTVRDLMAKHGNAQNELSRALQELYGELSMRPKNKGLIRKWNVASFSLKELENNWNSLQFAFQHLLVSNETPTSSSKAKTLPILGKRKNYTPTVLEDAKTRKVDHSDCDSESVSVKTEFQPTSESEDERKVSTLVEKTNGETETDEEKLFEGNKEEDEDDENHNTAVTRRSPRIRESSILREKQKNSRTGGKKQKEEDKRKQNKKPSQMTEKGKKVRTQSIGPNDENDPKSQNGEHVPIVRQSLRRVLELSKQSYKEEVKDESEKESEGEEEDEQQEEEPEQESKEQPPPQPEKPERKTEKAKSHGLSAKASRLREKALLRKKKTPEHVLARQRELYRIRKEKSTKLNPESSSSLSSSSQQVPVKETAPAKSAKPEPKLTSAQLAKNRPWSKVTTRKTAPHILIKRKEQYYKKKALKALEAQNPQKRSRNAK